MNVQIKPDIVFAQTALQELAEQKGWGIRPFYGPEKGWEYEPFIPGMIIPAEVEKRRELILKSVPVKGFVIGHEIEKVPDKPFKQPVIPWKKVSIVAGATAAVAALTTTAAVALVVVAVAAAASLIVSALPLLLLLPLVFIDPCLIVVLPSGEMYMVAKWDKDSSLMRSGY